MKKFNQHILESKLSSYLNDEITCEDVINSILSDQMNEGIIDNFKNFLNSAKSISEKNLEKLIEWAKKTFDVEIDTIKKLYDFIKKTLKKVYQLFIQVLKKIKQFKENNPVLFKVIVIITLIILIVMISAATAWAQSQGQPVDLVNDFGVTKDGLDMLIGLHEEMLSDGSPTNIKLQAALIDLKDGKIDLSYNSVELCKTYINELKGLIQSKPQLKVYLADFREVGEKLIDVSVETIKRYDDQGNLTYSAEHIDILKKN